MATKTPTKPVEPLERSAAKKRAPRATKTAAKKSSALVAASLPAELGAHPKSGKVDKRVAKPRPLLVRDSFTMPEPDFALLASLKSTALGARRAAKKSELLRAGLRALATLDAKALVAALDQLEAVKTGRPRKGH